MKLRTSGGNPAAAAARRVTLQRNHYTPGRNTPVPDRGDVASFIIQPKNGLQRGRA